MKSSNIVLTCILIFLFIGCSNKDEYKVSVNKTKNILLTPTNIINKLNKKEKEFYLILENDSYASICNSENKYILMKNTKDLLIKSSLLKELFYEYVNNLNNSCLNTKDFKQTLAQNKYKKHQQYYEIYNKKIDKKSLLTLYDNNKNSIEDILSKYKPKHPDFFKFIKVLDEENLNKKEHKKLRLNIERLKLIKTFSSNNFIQLNVPSYKFFLYEKGNKVKSFGTIVGSIKSQTPILSSELTHFIINPSWNIPDSIARQTIIPNALKDKNYLRDKNIVIRKIYNLNSKKYKFEDINWQKYLKEKNTQYRFIQLASKTNAMGRVKFMFTNDYSVYMHDTISLWRFKIKKEKIRFKSHGCIRLEHPLSLMKHITKEYTKYSYLNIRKTYKKEQTKKVVLRNKLPIHITYLTTYIKNGKIGFYKDIYGYDKIQKLNF